MVYRAQIVCRASGASMASLLKPMLEKLSPALEKRRLMPLKHPALQIGNAAAFTYCLQQEPPLLPLSQARALLATPVCLFIPLGRQIGRCYRAVLPLLWHPVLFSNRIC